VKQTEYNKRLHQNKLRTLLSHEKKTNEIYKQRVEDAEVKRIELEKKKAQHISQSKLNRKRRREEQRAAQNNNNNGGGNSNSNSMNLGNGDERKSKKQKTSVGAKYL